VKDGNGQWWAVFLGDRPYRDNFENLGRETFMLPVNWTDDGFPVILPAGESVPMIVRHEGVKRSDKVTFGNFSFTDEFDDPVLGDAWMTVRTPAKDLYSLTDMPGYLKLTCSEVKSTGNHTPAFVGRRLHHHKFSASTRMYFTPSGESESAGLLVFKDERHQYFFKVSKEGIALQKVEFEILAESGKPFRWAQVEGYMASAKLGKFSFIDLKVTSDGETFSFWYAPNGKNWKALIEGVDASYLTSASVGGFTGTLVGPYAEK
jgi:alpha-N-arabinofuranosidase